MKKKLTKLLSIFLVAGVIGTSVAFAGCNNDPTPDTPPEPPPVVVTDAVTGVEVSGTTTVEVGATTTLTATVSGTGNIAKTVTWSTDHPEIATVANGVVTGVAAGTATITATSTADTTKKKEVTVTVTAPTPPPPAEARVIGVNLADHKGNLADGTALGTGTGLSIYAAGAAVVCEGNNGKKAFVDGAEVAAVSSAGARLKLDKKIDDASNAKGIKVATTENASIFVYAYSSSGSEERNLVLYDDAFQAIAGTTVAVAGTDNILDSVRYDVEGGKTYYIGAEKGINLYYIAVVYGDKETKGTLVAAKAATCEEAGNPAHYYTSFGRYVLEDGTQVNHVAAKIAKKGHKFTYAATDVTLPTATTEGKVALTCANSSADNKEVKLPKLGSGVYTRTTEGQAEGKCKYEINCDDVYDGDTKTGKVSFIADYVAEIEIEYVHDIANIATVDGDSVPTVGVGKANAQAFGDMKIYCVTDADAVNGNIKVSAEDGVIQMIDTDTAKTIWGCLVFDEAKTSGLYRVEGMMELASAGGWDPIQIIGSALENASGNGILAGLSTVSTSPKSFALHTAGSGSEGRGAGGEVELITEWAYFRFDLNLDEHTVKVSVSADGTTWSLVGEANEPQLTSFIGLRFQTASGSRSFNIKNIKIYEGTEKAAS